MSQPNRKGGVSAPLLCFSVAFAVAGCQSPDDEDGVGPPKASSVAFTGKPDPRLAGSWKSTDGSSTLAMSEDGKLALTASSPGRSGASEKMPGEWRVDGSRLLLKYATSGGAEQTVAYEMKLAGDTLTLSTKVPKRDTVYKKD